MKKPKSEKAKTFCAVCGASFGLIRHRFSDKQFCSKQCLEQYLVDIKQQTDRFMRRIDPGKKPAR